MSDTDTSLAEEYRLRVQEFLGTTLALTTLAKRQNPRQLSTMPDKGFKPWLKAWQRTAKKKEGLDFLAIIATLFFLEWFKGKTNGVQLDRVKEALSLAIGYHHEGGVSAEELDHLLQIAEEREQSYSSDSGRLYMAALEEITVGVPAQVCVALLKSVRDRSSVATEQLLTLVAEQIPRAEKSCRATKEAILCELLAHYVRLIRR